MAHPYNNVAKAETPPPSGAVVYPSIIVEQNEPLYPILSKVPLNSVTGMLNFRVGDNVTMGVGVGADTYLVPDRSFDKYRMETVPAIKVKLFEITF